MRKHTIFVGLDVHKDTIDIAFAEGGRDGEVRYYGTIKNDIKSLEIVIRKLRSKDRDLRFIYEAGPCGYELYRYLVGNGLDCSVAAPSMIPRKSGSRVKNDRRDSMSLARLHRSGELTAVYVPRPEDEAIRDMTRGRADAVKAARVAKQQLLAFLLRHGKCYEGRTYWSKAYWHWLATVKMEHRSQQIVLHEYMHVVREASERVQRFTDQIKELVSSWRLVPLVTALQSLRGVSLIVAVTTVAELGDLTRFESARQLMAYLGLVPSEHSSGTSVRRGGITKTGNSHVRRALVEAAQAYRLPAREGVVLKARLQNVEQEVRQISWQAQVRLCSRFRRLMQRGKEQNKVIIATARELAGFMWAISLTLTNGSKPSL
ncbi:MAG: IS110 family transposase [Desulfofustis sp.]|nr:IS110 family transposase [Desulfofustis sp.]